MCRGVSATALGERIAPVVDEQQLARRDLDDAGVTEAAARVFVDLQPIGPLSSCAIDAEHDAVARPAVATGQDPVAHQAEIGVYPPHGKRLVGSPGLPAVGGASLPEAVAHDAQHVAIGAERHDRLDEALADVD